MRVNLEYKTAINIIEEVLEETENVELAESAQLIRAHLNRGDDVNLEGFKSEDQTKEEIEDEDERE